MTGALPNGCLKKDLRFADIGESGESKEPEREGELMLADSAASRCLRVNGFGGMLRERAGIRVGYMRTEGRDKQDRRNDLGCDRDEPDVSGLTAEALIEA